MRQILIRERNIDALPGKNVLEATAPENMNKQQAVMPLRQRLLESRVVVPGTMRGHRMKVKKKRERRLVVPAIVPGTHKKLITSQTMTLRPGHPKPRWTERYGTDKTMPKSEYGVWNPNHATFLASQPIPVSPPDAGDCQEIQRDAVTSYRGVGGDSRTRQQQGSMPGTSLPCLFCPNGFADLQSRNGVLLDQVCYQQVKVWKAAFLVMRIAAEAR
ncbi:hypothetical protein QFC21_001117 [Naganishia friedmannii]|uniref:Uncharacterized protein n=1 Tax=Naganishia friedmannii TaxID=89922 RepID=A0ACC2WAN1_9TREE|nr:hypothetical protein QFC21_001117 [Naganishia friedmannii]